MVRMNDNKERRRDYAKQLLKGEKMDSSYENWLEFDGMLRRITTSLELNQGMTRRDAFKEALRKTKEYYGFTF